MKGIAALVIVLAPVLFIIQLGQRSLTSEEVRWGQVAREMRQNGQYFHPTINGQLYYDKPLASYWLIVAVSYFTGGVDEFTARFPSALAGFFSVLLILRLGQRTSGLSHGVLAAAILATMFGFTIYSRRASADLENLAGILAAVLLYFEMKEATRMRWVLGLWLIMGVTSSMKGLLGFALPVLIIGVDCTWNAVVSRSPTQSLQKSWLVANRWLFNGWSLLAVPFGIGCFIAPYIISTLDSGSDEGLAMVFRENLQRFISPHNHTGPVYLYLGVLLLLAAPWSLFLPAALIPQANLQPNSQTGAGHRMIIIAFCVTFFFFTASASRRSYYLLPILPWTSLLVSRLLLANRDDLRPAAVRLRNVGGLLFVILFLLGVVALALPGPWRPVPFDKLPAVPGISIAIALGLVAVIAMLQQLWLPSIVLMVVTAYAAFAFAFFVLMPVAEEYRTRPDFVRDVLVQTQQDWPHLALFHSRDIVYELNPPQSLADHTTSERLASAISNGATRWAIVRRRYLPLISFRYVIISEESVQPWEGIDQQGDKMMLIGLEK